MFNHQPHRKRRGLTPEEQLHLAVANYLQAALRPPVFWSTIGHGSKVSHREAGLLKAKGLKPGLPDILVMTPLAQGGTRIIGIELKAAKGRASEAQHDMAETFNAAGADYAVCRTIEAVAEALECSGVPLHARMMGGGGIIRCAA